ncbi:pimeloyl-ACP methyl ester carboxylesterase [Sphingomonas kyeonggiensis]|uniref:Pimeloyl-ACP methyl ester carboxylesterase n=1 Tax=Sphingomonas kyeonggiensis TaxID=1268553 RepID=A0A7W7JZ90_9SPHN|nr:alpha/beta hydrolase [Sphingomonas kyeonggiensis]MBB4838132.1 pimeloyl-ACP methyl ester carboxylesterase [Sphingomonas kyeonggiensis]
MNKTIAALASASLATSAAPALASDDAGHPTIVLIHGAFVDGSGWAGVYNILRKDGYEVVVLQNPTTSLEDDVAATRRALATIKGKVVLVGHSYGGVIITEAGSDPKVTALVYVAAFAPDQGESVSSIVASAPPGAPALPIIPSPDGTLTLDKAQFPALFAGDVAPETARFMADSQQPWGAKALEGKITVPAWKTRPSWFVVPKDDHIIPPAGQRGMAQRARATLREVPGSHAVFVSKPEAIAAVIEEAAQGGAAKRGQ